MATHRGGRFMVRGQLVGWIAVFVVGLTVAGHSPAAAAAEAPLTKPSKIALDEHGVLVIDGTRVFPITLTIVPGPGAQAPSGKHAYAEFVDGGVTFIRTGKADWNAETIQLEKDTQAAAAKYGLR